MDDQQVGAIFRAARIRRGMRQQDVATAARVARSWVSRVERGQLGSLPVDLLRRLAGVLEIRLDLSAMWRGADGARLVNETHSGMQELVARRLAGLPAWEFATEVTFSHWGERGAIDILGWHAASRTLLVVELKTELVDPAGLVAQVDRHRRLAPAIGRDRGWGASRVATWVVVADTATNRRQLARHRTMLRNAFPLDGRAFGAWLRDPLPAGEPPAVADARHRGDRRAAAGPTGRAAGGPDGRSDGGPAPGGTAGLAFLAYALPGTTSARIGATKRVRRRTASSVAPRPRPRDRPGAVAAPPR